jgi:hypothetical protein
MPEIPIEEARQKLLAHLVKHEVTPKCPMCGHGKISVEGQFWVLVEPSEPHPLAFILGGVASGRSMPLIVCACPKCGYAIFFSVPYCERATEATGQGDNSEQGHPEGQVDQESKAQEPPTPPKATEPQEG